MTDAPPPVSVSKRGTIIVRIRRGYQRAGLRWLRGVLVAGVAAGVLAAIKFLL